MEFYKKLNDKELELYLDLWNPKEFQGYYKLNDIGGYERKCVRIDFIDEIDEDGINKNCIPMVSLEICFDMLERLGYEVDVMKSVQSENYHCILNSNILEMDRFSGKNRLESLKMSLKWALEKEVNK